ncbi:MAG TPA: hypothetical protein VN903_31155, partial [Polyangia bacterium]|nr:hypothetical protein [Polyangia bacterium]
SSGGTTNDGGTDNMICTRANDYPNDVYFLELDNVKRCATPPPDPTPRSCKFAPVGCCLQNSECTQGTAGRCIPNPGNPCGGAAPVGNICSYDGCTTDASCTAGMPAGATVSVCVPAGAFNFLNARCIYGGCRTDADCTQSAGGKCLYGNAATHGTMCDLRQVFYCAYPSDPCQGRNDGCTGLLICLPEENYQGRRCAMGPPMYP